jgi:ribonuclease D
MSTIDQIIASVSGADNGKITGDQDVFIRKLMSSLILSSKSSNNLQRSVSSNAKNANGETNTDSVSDAFKYQRLVSPEFSSATDRCVTTAKSTMQKIINFSTGSNDDTLPDDIADPAFYESIRNIVDVLLDSASVHMAAADSSSSSSAIIKQSVLLDKDRILRMNVKLIPKPQEAFYTDIDNSRTNPFKPRLNIKYHQTVPLDLVIRPVEPQYHEDGEEDESVGPATYYPHPYEEELRQLSYTTQQMHGVTGGDGKGKDRKKGASSSSATFPPPPPIALHPFALVDSPAALNDMIQELMAPEVSEIAVDLEHHSTRTFQGLACLMQISSRSKDYVIDTLSLRQQLPLLGQVFANPSIVKVLHGCEKDILWLQRDLGLYIVNCFDTYYAAKTLMYPALSLAHLLNYHCGVVVNKKHQLSDWRQRPIPEDLLHYAREDTHYLLYTYDCLRRDLWKAHGKSGLENVLDASRKTCLSRYEKPSFHPSGYRMLLAKLAPRGGAAREGSLDVNDISVVQDNALAALWEWRDRLARELDESCDYVMSHSLLLRIGLRVPQTLDELSQCVMEGLTSVTDGGALPGSAMLSVYGDAILSLLLGVTSLAGTSTAAGSSGFDRSRDAPDRLLTSSSYAGSSSGSSSSMASSVYTFTPAVLTSPVKGVQGSAQSSPSGVGASSVQSPVMAVEDIFRLAGWSTPSGSFYSSSSSGRQYGGHGGGQGGGLFAASCSSPTATDNRAVSAPSPFAFDSIRPMEISEENKLKLTQGKEEQRKDFETRLKHLATTDKQPPLRSSGNAVTIPGTSLLPASSSFPGHRAATVPAPSSPLEDEEDLDEEEEESIPRSYEEIYQISLRNRQRNKDKKRGRGDDGRAETDGGAQMEDEDGGLPRGYGKQGQELPQRPEARASSSSGAGASPSSAEGKKSSRKFDHNSYFVENKVELDADSTLDFVGQIGWITSKEHMQSVKEGYLQEVAYQQQSEHPASAPSSPKTSPKTNSPKMHSMQLQHGEGEGQYLSLPSSVHQSSMTSSQSSLRRSGDFKGGAFPSSSSSARTGKSFGAGHAPFDYDAIAPSVMAGLGAGSGPSDHPSTKGGKGGKSGKGNTNIAYTTGTDDGLSSTRHKPFNAKSERAENFNGTSGDRQRATNPYLK